MKIAIHQRKDSFSDIWIEYCQINNIPFKLVNCYDSDITVQLNDCDGLMWHWPQWDSKAILFARQLTYSLELSGKKVFPDSNTCWHFDDKIGQKYLFEALGLDSIPTWIFYDKKSAYKWIKNTEYPLVFKLRGGASSKNVKLVKTSHQAKNLVKRAFGKGFKISGKWNKLKDRILKFQKEKTIHSLLHLGKGFFRIIRPNYNERMSTRDKGYLYFQKFVPDNDSDIRLVVVGNRCFGMRRYIRKNDFRASGSVNKSYDPQLINIEVVKLAFEASQKLKMQSVAFDFIKDNNKYKIIEISYAFTSKQFPGYWDSNLKWNEGVVSPQKYMIEDFINEQIKAK